MSEIDGSQFRSAPGFRAEPKRKTIDEKLKDASQMYEKLFMREMMKAMRSTVGESGFIKQNAAEKLFREEMDAETVNNWSNQQGGVGLADMIYNNLIEKYGAQMGLREKLQNAKGPIKLDDKSNYNGPVRAQGVRPGEVTYRFDKKNEPAAPANEPSFLTSPWDAKITESRNLGEGVHLLGLSHDDGLSGKFVFRGTADRLNVGQSVQGGERIGLLSPDAKSFFWTLALESAPGAENPGPALAE